MTFEQEQIQFLPKEPGVYIMKNRKSEILYIGKAKNIRNRIRSYFNPESDKRPQIPALINQLDDLETIITKSEHEAFLLENLLIKQHQPRFNIRLRDDKNYVSIRINLSHPFPRLEVMRRTKMKKEKDNVLYFGPYTSGRDVREAIKLIRRIFPLRNCKETMFKTRTRPCLQFEIKRCLGPCVNKVSKEDYAELIKGAIRFLKGDGEGLVKDLESKMAVHAEKMEYEKAATIRDQINAIKSSLKTQNVTLQKWDNRDIFGLAEQDTDVVVVVLVYRNGNLVSTHEHSFKCYIQTAEEVLSSVIYQFYDSGNDVPEEVIIDRPIEDNEVVAEFLAERRGRKVEFISPKRGEKLDLVEFAVKNAQIRLEKKIRKEDNIELGLKEIEEHLHLPRHPAVIECFDISNIQGAFAVGSMVCFSNGEPDKAKYRRYKIKTVSGSNDFAMMKEVIDRRYKRALEEERTLPDLLLVDGGKGQLEMAAEVLHELGISEKLPVASIAKTRMDREEGDYQSLYVTDALAADLEKAERGQANPKHIDRFFLPGRKNPVFFQPGSQGLKILMRVRDEAHRFAVDYHHKLMKNARFHSALEEIPGIGPKQRKKLLGIFGSLQGIRDASLDDLKEKGGLSADVALNVFNFYHQK